VRLAAIAAVIALTLVIAACGGDDDEASSDTRALVTFAKSGGVASKVYSLTVDRGGGAQLTTYPSKIKKFNIGADKRDELTGLLAGGKDLDSNYESKTPVADASRYSITYESKTISASDSAELPDKLRSLINLLDGIVENET